MIRRHPVIPLPDYQRIYQVIYSVLDTSDIANVPKACIFFATAGALLLRKHYKLQATISAGSFFFVLDGASNMVAAYAKEEDGQYNSDNEGFHAWVECEGWFIDFMAPIMRDNFQQDGRDFKVPRRMLQKTLASAKDSHGDLDKTGDFCIQHDANLAEYLIDHQSAAFMDLINIVDEWYVKPPKPLKLISILDTGAGVKQLRNSAPSLSGVW